MIPILIGLVPTVITLIEKLVPDAPTAQKHTWVLGFFQDIATALTKYIPSWLTPELPALEALLAEAVQAELDKLLPNG